MQYESLTLCPDTVPPLRSLDNSLHRLFLDLALTGPASIALDHALGTLLGYPRLHSVTLPLTDSQYQSRLDYRQLAWKHSVNNL